MKNKQTVSKDFDLSVKRHSLYLQIHHADYPLSFPLCEGLIPPGSSLYHQFCLWSHPNYHLRLKIAVGGSRHLGWKKRYWPCAIIRGADTHCWQSLEHGLGVTITLALLSRIRTIPVKPSHDRNCQHLFIFASATAADNSSIVSNKGPDPWSLLGVCWR